MSQWRAKRLGAQVVLKVIEGVNLKDCKNVVDSTYYNGICHRCEGNKPIETSLLQYVKKPGQEANWTCRISRGTLREIGSVKRMATVSDTMGMKARWMAQSERHLSRLEMS